MKHVGRASAVLGFLATGIWLVSEGYGAGGGWVIFGAFLLTAFLMED